MNTCKNKVLNWVPRLLVVRLKGDFNVPAWARWVVTKWPFKFVFCAELAEESGDLGHSPGAWFYLHCTTEILSNTVGKLATDNFKISKILQELEGSFPHSVAMAFTKSLWSEIELFPWGALSCLFWGWWWQPTRQGTPLGFSLLGCPALFDVREVPVRTG